MSAEWDPKRRLQSLDTIENVDWGEPTFHSSLVITCHRLRKKPIGEFTVEDLRIMIGQRISPMFLVPLALEKLADDPIAGELYPGDLLNSLFRLPTEFWQRHTDYCSHLEVILSQLLASPDRDVVVPSVLQAIHDFRTRVGTH